MEIRPAQEGDYEQMVTLRRDTIIDVNSKDYPLRVIAEWAARGNTQKMKEAAQRCNMWVAIFHDTLVGFCSHNLENLLSRLYVHKDYQGRGIGSRLLAEAEADLRKRGCKEVHLEATITAKDFYERQGYTVVQETVDAQNPKITVITMSKKLTTD